MLVNRVLEIAIAFLMIWGLLMTGAYFFIKDKQRKGEKQKVSELYIKQAKERKETIAVLSSVADALEEVAGVCDDLQDYNFKVGVMFGARALFENKALDGDKLLAVAYKLRDEEAGWFWGNSPFDTVTD